MSDVTTSISVTCVMDDSTRFRDFLDVGQVTGSIYAALSAATRENTYDHSLDEMQAALKYLWDYTYNPKTIELESGMRMMPSGAEFLDETGWPIKWGKETDDDS